MSKHKVKFATLTSFHSTLFFYLDSNTKVLYMSRTHQHDEPGALGLFFAWFASSMELIRKPTLPNIDFAAVDEFEKSANQGYDKLRPGAAPW